MGEILTGIYTSDRHELYPRSRLKNGLSEETLQAVSELDFYIDGGDRYDFHYCIYYLIQEFKHEHPGEEIFNRDERYLNPELKLRLQAAIDDAIGSMEYEIGSCPETIFLQLAGNHDNFRRYFGRLDKVQKRHAERFAWNAEFFILGNAYFEHGDWTLRKHKNEDEREILRFKTFAEAGWQIGLEMRLHDIVQAVWFDYWNKPDLVVPRFHRHLAKQRDKDTADAINATTERFFGHIHIPPFDKTIFDGEKNVTYHQTGAAIKDRVSKPLQITLELPPGYDKRNFLTHQRPHANIILPEARILDVSPANIPGLTFDPKNFASRITESRQRPAQIGK